MNPCASDTYEFKGHDSYMSYENGQSHMCR